MAEINNAYYVFGMQKFRNIEKIDQGTSRLDGWVFNNNDLISKIQEEDKFFSHYGILCQDTEDIVFKRQQKR